MPNTYDFQNLSFEDFERLTQDLLQKSLSVRLESFRTGRDGGVDLRYAPGNKNELIVQCKRYSSGAFSRLLADISSKELPKIKRLRPKRYILSTSCSLSPDNKEKLLAVLSPYCIAPADIFSAEDLNALLVQHKEVEERHFKLWLGSTAVLQQVLHAGIFNYSKHETDRLRREISRYVVHGGIDRALEVLEREHHCIIVGMPGVGKTTAARILLAHYMRDDYEIVVVSGDVEEAWRVLEHQPNGKNVVVYYDDFLGQMAFSQKLNKNEDRRLLDLISLCHREKGKRFILTTRDYIFDQALNSYEPLGRSQEQLRRSSIVLDDYGPIVRARLLANHLQFSDVPTDSIKEIVASKTYLEIIKHQNFLPRIVEQICSSPSASTQSPKEFSDNAIRMFNDPNAVWRTPFNHLSGDAKLLVFVLASLDGEHELSMLEAAWKAASARMPTEILPRTFAEVMRETEGCFTSTQAYPSVSKSSGQKVGVFVRFINPSAREFALSSLMRSPNVFSHIVDTAINFRQLLCWMELRQSPESQRTVVELADRIFSQAIELIAHSEPQLIVFGGERSIVWNKQPSQLERLRELLRAARHAGDSYLAAIARRIFANGGSLFMTIVGTQNLWRLDEAMSTLVSACSPHGEMSGSNLEGFIDWTINLSSAAVDMGDLLFAWRATEQVIDFSSVADKRRNAVAAYVEAARGLVAAVDFEWPSESISEAMEYLETLALELDFCLDKELERLDVIRDRVEQREVDAEDDQRRGPIAHPVVERGSAEQQIADMFSDLVSQTC